MAHRRDREGDVQRRRFARRLADIATERAVARVQIDHIQLELRLPLDACEERAPALDERRVKRSAIRYPAGEIMAAHEVDGSEVMTPPDFVGQHAAETAMVDLQVRLALRPAQLERARTEPIGVDEQHCLKQGQSSSDTLSMNAGAPTAQNGLEGGKPAAESAMCTDQISSI
jgi:hypothetical protein